METALAIEWLKASFDDLENIRYIIDVKNLTNISAFHAQQSIEKSLKALLEAENSKIPKTHKIQVLLNLIDEDLKMDLYLVKLLDELYIDSRYPGDMGILPYGKPTLEDAKEFYDFATTVFNEVCKKLNIDKKELL